MQAVKTFDSTGIAPNGRVYATDLNAIQAAAAGLTDLAQNISVASLIVGEAGLALSRVGAGEMQAAGGFRSTGILRGLGGIYAGQFTSTQRDAIAVGGAPTGLIIYNTTTVQFEWNSGTDGARVWKAVGFDQAGDLILTGGASSLEFTAQTAANYFLNVKRLADTVARFAIKEDGTIEIGPGGATARDVTLFRSGAGVLSLGAAVKLILGSGGIQFSDGTFLTTLTDAITAAMISPNAIGASELADASVDTAAIIDAAVTTLKILDGNVTLAKLAAASVDTTKIANSLKPSGGAANATEALRALGTTAGTAAAGDDTRFLGSTTINFQTAGYTLVLSDRGKMIDMASAGALTLLVPADAVGFQVGDLVHVMQSGAGQVTVAGTGGATVVGNPGLKTAGQWATATMMKRAANSWVLFGGITS